MKKSYLKILLLPLFVFSFVSCEVEDPEDKGDELPPDIVETGFYGSWTNNNVTHPLLATRWYIEENVTSVANICDFGDQDVAVVVEIDSTVENGILRFTETDSKTVTIGENTCTVSVSPISYALALSNAQTTLSATRAGTTTVFTRINPVDP